ncbi:MAG: hypothetical protein ACMZ66_07960 [Thalassospira sp.]|uniref:hypothetical protein n=1 Tax=Thalassospira sp. TaxID=1912094 RepID=UPI003A87F28F
MDKNTKGAWIIHHGRKIHGNTNGAAEYSAIDLAAKSAGLLSRMAGSDQAELPHDTVVTLARVGGLNPKTELNACLEQLENQKVIDRSASGTVAVLGVTPQTALAHASDLYDRNEPNAFENASLGIGELVSTSPILLSNASEFISDTYRISGHETNEFLEQASALGFIDSDGDKDDPLLFNGNLFRRDTVSKTKKVLDSLSSAEQVKLSEFEDTLRRQGAVHLNEATTQLGETLLAKLRSAAVFDENIVSNEAGDHSYITSPGAFNKFVNPLVDDAFDHAKALVAALSYGMTRSAANRGKIWGVNFILRKLVNGEWVGPVTAIGKDYRALELERVVQTRRQGYGYVMRLLKREVGEIAQQVLAIGKASDGGLTDFPSAQVTGYTAPEAARTAFKKRADLQPTNTQMRSLISAVRSGGGL